MRLRLSNTDPALDGCKRLASPPGCFTSRETVSGIYRMRHWLDPRTILLVKWITATLLTSTVLCVLLSLLCHSFSLTESGVFHTLQICLPSSSLGSRNTFWTRNLCSLYRNGGCIAFCNQVYHIENVYICLRNMCKPDKHNIKTSTQVLKKYCCT